MTPELPGDASAPSRSESERLRDCSSLVALLADQLEALEQGDLPRLRELESMRGRLAGEMREEIDPDTPLLPWLAERVEEALRRVDGWIESDRHARDEVAQLQDGSLPLVRGLHRRAGSGTYPSLEPGGAKLDVRL